MALKPDDVAKIDDFELREIKRLEEYIDLRLRELGRHGYAKRFEIHLSTSNKRIIDGLVQLYGSAGWKISTETYGDWRETGTKFILIHL